MNSRVMIAMLMLSGLTGCAPVEHIVVGFLPDHVRNLSQLTMQPIERPAARPKVAKPPPKPEPALARVPELSFPSWSIPSPRPLRTLRYVLAPSELFKRLSASVYVVSTSGSQGSAVAISARELITACHVVTRGGTITLINGNAIIKAEVIASDLATDRCWLRADGELMPVPGFREADSLVVGETVYTIGSPKGLVNSLGSGLLAGLRTAEDGTEYIQITAPVSSGSSGGGLFDDKGNLIGIVTFTIRDAQNLNFAISGSMFWRGVNVAAASVAMISRR